jgi:hypothetical protein
MCRVIILVLQDSCTIYYSLWPPDNTSCSLSNTSYHEETSCHLVSCYASVGSDASAMLVL